MTGRTATVAEGFDGYLVALYADGVYWGTVRVIGPRPGAERIAREWERDGLVDGRRP